jgi:SAM-dependent methyltransferase
MGSESSERCPWVSRMGSIRDFPKIGVVECENCQLVTHETDLREFIDYKSGSMHDWTSGYGGTLDTPKEDISRRVSAIKALASQNQIDSILDFGSGKGEMIFALSECFNVYGLEPEDSARENCLNGNAEVFASSEEIQKINRNFDLVTLFHVVEHFYTPTLEISRIYDLLRPGGHLIIETPNSQDILLTKYKSKAFSEFTYWSHHPMLHSSISLANLLEKSGFEIVENAFVQRYGLANHLYWLASGQPGGHVIWANQFSKSTECEYAQNLLRDGNADTLWVIAKKRK